jgi:hypothetical protein
MEAYLDAMDNGILRAATKGFPEVEGVPPSPEQEKWNAKAKNTLLRSLGKEVFQQVRSAKTRKILWDKLIEIHMGTKDEREERYKVLMDKINCFKMPPHENANQMYSRLNCLVEELHDLDISKMSETDVIRRFLGALDEKKYAIITSILYNKRLKDYTMQRVLGKINIHESMMKLKGDDDSPSSSKKKDIALKATKEKKEKKKAIVIDDSSDDEDDNSEGLDEVALLVKQTTKMLRKLDKKGVKFNPKNKKFFVHKKKSLKHMDCYNCEELGHLAHQCPLPDKRKHKNNKKEDSDDEMEKKPTNKFKSKKKSYNRLRKVARPMLVNGSPMMKNLQMNPPQVIVRMKGLPALLLVLPFLLRQAPSLHQAHTFALWPKEATRYMIVMMIVMIVIAMMMIHLLMMI